MCVMIYSGENVLNLILIIRTKFWQRKTGESDKMNAIRQYFTQQIQ